MAKRLAFILLISVAFLAKVTVQNLQDDIESQMNQTERTLSRKRRYLVFPEGSSLQLVFCLTMPSIGMGNIFTVGSTAALAWELPHDPFVPFRKPADVLHRSDTPSNNSSSGGWIYQPPKSKYPASLAYYKTYFNPFLMGKPSASGYSTINGASQQSFGFTPAKIATGNNRRKFNTYSTLKSRNQIAQRLSQSSPYTSQKRYNKQPSVTTYLHPVYHQVYRRTRRDLYSKIEKLFTALNKNGRSCLLKSICEVSKATMKKGTFMEEIIKAIFRVRHHEDNGEEERDMYDLAWNQEHNCTELYSQCKQSIWDGMFS